MGFFSSRFCGLRGVFFFFWFCFLARLTLLKREFSRADAERRELRQQLQPQHTFPLCNISVISNRSLYNQPNAENSAHPNVLACSRCYRCPLKCFTACCEREHNNVLWVPSEQCALGNVIGVLFRSIHPFGKCTHDLPHQSRAVFALWSSVKKATCWGW